MRNAFASKSAAKIMIFFDICKYFVNNHKKICNLHADSSFFRKNGALSCNEDTFLIFNRTTLQYRNHPKPHNTPYGATHLQGQLFFPLRTSLQCVYQSLVRAIRYLAR